MTTRRTTKKTKRRGMNAGTSGRFIVASLWQLKHGQCTTRTVASFTHDFRVMLAQIAEEVGEKTPRGWEHTRTIRVCAESFDDFRKWAAELGPEEDRYEKEAIEVGVGVGVLDRRFLHDVTVDGKYWWQVVGERTRNALYKKGFERYVGALAKAISAGDDIPPLIRVDGIPADGRHRTFAANKLRLSYAPVVEFTTR